MSFIVLGCLSETYSSISLYEGIISFFKYFKNVEYIVSESAQASALKKVGLNEVQKQLQNISETQPKKRQCSGNYDTIKQAGIVLSSPCVKTSSPCVKTCSKEIRVKGRRNCQGL